MDLHRCTELYPLWSMTFMTSYSHSCSVGRGRGSTNCKLTVLEESIICFTKQGARADRTVITCWGACKVSVLKILPALHNNYVNAGLCWNPAELLGILLMSSFPILPSVLLVLFFLCYTSFPECTQTVVIMWAWYNSYNAIVCIVGIESRDNHVIPTAILKMHIRWLKFLIYLFLSLFGKDL